MTDHPTVARFNDDTAATERREAHALVLRGTVGTFDYTVST